MAKAGTMFTPWRAYEFSKWDSQWDFLRISQMGLTCGRAIWAKYPKAAGKFQNQHFLGKTMRKTWGTSQFFE